MKAIIPLLLAATLACSGCLSLEVGPNNEIQFTLKPRTTDK